MATQSSVLAWRIPGMGEPGGLPSMGSHRVRHDWSDLAAAAAAASAWSLGWEDPLEEEMAGILACRIPMDRGAWWATVHGITKSRTRPTNTFTESANWNSGKVMEAEWRLFPIIKETGDTERLCAQEPRSLSSFPNQGSNSCPSAVEAQSPNHWTTRKFSPNPHMISHKPTESVNLNIPLNLGNFLSLFLQIFSISFSLSSSSGPSTICMLAFLILSHTSLKALWHVFILFPSPLPPLLFLPSPPLPCLLSWQQATFSWLFLSGIVWDYNPDIVNAL